MTTADLDPWLLELLVVGGGSHTASERRALSRDVERGLLARIRQGVYVEAAVWAALSQEQRHVVRMRALAAVSHETPVFSHWSAVVALGLPVDRRGLLRLHVSGGGEALHRRRDVSGHAFPVALADVVEVGGLLVTAPARTVVDVAAAWGFEPGVQVADAALFEGLSRLDLDAAAEAAAGRRAGPRVQDVVDFAHPGGESANESQARCTMFRLGVEPPELQVGFSDERGFIARVDTWWPAVRGVGEADGAKKYLDPELAREGAGRAVFEEKRREDRLRAQCAGLARWGWAESISGSRLAPVLARIRVVPLRRRPLLADWARVARGALPRVHPSPTPSPSRPLPESQADRGWLTRR